MAELKVAAAGAVGKVEAAVKGAVDKVEGEIKKVEGEVKAAVAKLVQMFRDAEQFPDGPHTADVHPDEVGNMQAGGWLTEDQMRAQAEAQAKAAAAAAAAAEAAATK